jgi:hypothetical protein
MIQMTNLILAMDYHRTNLHSEFKCVCIYKDKFPYFCYILVVVNICQIMPLQLTWFRKACTRLGKTRKKYSKKVIKKKKRKKKKHFLTHLFFIFQIIIL